MVVSAEMQRSSQQGNLGPGDTGLLECSCTNQSLLFVSHTTYVQTQKEIHSEFYRESTFALYVVSQVQSGTASNPLIPTKCDL